MKQLTCELCGSTDLRKENGVFVCEYCGCKYSAEEAKKLMIEGTVKVDNSDFVQKSLENARRAKAKEDWEECEKYYNMVEQHDPHNIEAIFYSSYGKAQMSMVESDRFKREQKVNVLKKSISIIDDNYDASPEKYAEQKRLIEQINDDLIALVNGSFVYNKTTSSGVETTNDKQYTYDMFNQLCLGWIESLQNIINVIGDDKESVYLWKLIRQNYTYVFKHAYKAQARICFDKIEQTDEIIKRLDPNYNPTKLYDWTSGGCYVATCVYGSYDCPQVWTLRRYRDYTLAETWYGRTFIHIYYSVSPTIVKLFGNTKWFKKMWKCKLDKIVADLQANGVENTPYNDRKW